MSSAPIGRASMAKPNTNSFSGDASPKFASTISRNFQAGAVTRPVFGNPTRESTPQQQQMGRFVSSEYYLQFEIQWSIFNKITWRIGNVEQNGFRSSNISRVSRPKTPIVPQHTSRVGKRYEFCHITTLSLKVISCNNFRLDQCFQCDLIFLSRAI